MARQGLWTMLWKERPSWRDRRLRASPIIMNIQRNEIRTGLLVVISLAVLVAVLLYLGAPGVFVKQKTFRVYVENAAIPSRLERLARRLSEIQGMGAQQAYQSALRDTMKVRRDTAMLGLARLAHEAKVSLTMRTTGERVTVCATTAPWRVTGHFRART